MAPPEAINWAIYNSLPPKEAEYQLAHVHDSKRVSLAIAYIICIPTIFLAVLMRFVSRRIGHIKYGADDWMMVLGLVITPFYDASLYHISVDSESSGRRLWLLQTVSRPYWVCEILGSNK